MADDKAPRADVAELSLDVEKINAGVWVAVNPDAPFEVKVKGQTQVYNDALHALRRKAALDLNRKLPTGAMLFAPGDLPPSVENYCVAKALADHVFLDVRGLLRGAEPITADEYREMLLDPERWTRILNITLSASLMATLDRSKEVEDAGK